MNQYSQDSDVDSPPKTRKKRAQVKNACVNCQRACKRCDSGRPCQRCVKHSLQDTCVDSTRKPRARGIKRGPYKKRNKEKENENDGRASSSARNARARVSTRIKRAQQAQYSAEDDEDDAADGDGDYKPTIRIDDQTDHVARLSSARMARFWRSPMLPRSPASSIGEGSSDFETPYKHLHLPPLGTFDPSSDSDTDQSPMPLTLLEASMPTPHSSSPLSLLSDVALNSLLATPKHPVSRFSYAYRVPPPRFPLAVESARDAFSRPASAANSPMVDDRREVAEMESSVQSPVPGSRTVRRLSRLLSGTRISENSRWVDGRDGDCCQRGWSEGTSAVCLTPPVSGSNRHHVQPVSESPPEDAAQLYESMSLYRISNEQPR